MSVAAGLGWFPYHLVGLSLASTPLPYRQDYLHLRLLLPAWPSSCKPSSHRTELLRYQNRTKWHSIRPKPWDPTV